jgi:RecQ family ATP-dependent DNA helicase
MEDRTTARLTTADVEAKFGVTLRDYQAKAIDSLCNNKDVILHVPTGGGKSIVFQGASHLLTSTGITVIVYPLRALIEDQQLAADKFGVNCVRYYGDVNQEDRADYLNQIKTDPTVSMVLTVPEMLIASKLLRDALKQRGVALMAIDEAHVYDEWALSFRSAYMKLSRVAEELAVRRLLLCSATLTAQGATQAARVFKRTEWEVISVPAIRPNLKFMTTERDPIRFLTEAVKSGQTPSPAPAIAFFTWKSTLEQIAEQVGDAATAKVPTYHADMGDAERKTAQAKWTKGREWVFATKAFGMGIDKADVRTIVHMQLPTSILDYAQEVGRAGRDGRDSYCYLPTFEYTTNGRRNDLGSAARFLVEGNYPDVGTVETVWDYLYRQLKGKPGWHKVDPARIADACLSSDKDAPTVRKCITWLSIAEMLKKRAHSTDWIFHLDFEGSGSPSAKEFNEIQAVIGAIKENARAVGATMVMSNGQMDDFVAPLVSVKDWKGKLKRWTNIGFMKCEWPGKQETNVQLFSTTFDDFHETGKLLMEARRISYENLSKVVALANAPAHRRAEMIEQAIRLDVKVFERAMVELRAQLAAAAAAR